MSASMLLTERAITTEGADNEMQSRAEAPRDARAAHSRARRAAPLLAMATGLLVLALAATVLVGARDGDRPVGQSDPVDTPAAADPLSITLTSRDISVVTQVYEPGEASGWHAHSGIHAVAVLSGVLTVYDGQCRPQTFGPGQPYVGGQELHLVRNETDAPVAMAVTYLSPSAPHSRATEPMAAPAGCPVG